MAKAKQRTKRVEVTTYKNQLDGTTLDLTMEETKFIYTVLIHIGGSPQHSSRKHADSILNAFRDAFEMGPITQYYDDPKLYDKTTWELAKGFGISKRTDESEDYHSPSIYFDNDFRMKS